MGFWNFFRDKKKQDSDEIESAISKDGTNDLIFAKNFTSFGGRFIFIDEKNSTNEIFQKIIEENQWSDENVCSLDSNISKNLNVRLIRKIDNDNVKALVTECEFLLSNTGRILICNKQIKSNRIEDLPPVVIILAKSNQFVSDVSEGMTGLKNKYKTNFPSNITTINVKNKLNEDNFLTYGNSAKDIYLILSDD
ncbi:MAG: LUD domain-containing protein [Cryomorphaceae bacterium]|nr:LUD domain-containing protein [Cryomorphaceae bacterium]MBT3503872.1 LUD domain-containing protein [Cryomorphaceae bacterium]MBT3689090.1 LUD domain-containing protein [Cryomorphaceae bacterium]MBT4222632.1 LUD domain-containing protein [Cryomorphaceae bacterium]MBT4518140.1 LUD domain-containing protein [Cryomorphaceae bacterium]